MLRFDLCVVNDETVTHRLPKRFITEFFNTVWDNNFLQSADATVAGVSILASQKASSHGIPVIDPTNHKTMSDSIALQKN